jgi:antitoxin CptB
VIEAQRIKREKLRWACRRGMLELDLFLVPFFEHCYETLGPDEKVTFDKLLPHTDPQLLAWLMGNEVTTDESLQSLVEKIRAFRRQNSAQAL